MTKRLIVLDLQTFAAPIVDLHAFVLANIDAPEIVARVLALEVREGFVVGGGAAPAFALTRWS